MPRGCLLGKVSCPGGLCPGGVCPEGVSALRGCLPRGVCLVGVSQHENITFPQLLLELLWFNIPTNALN